jgi:hypothetical protein
MLVAVLTSVCSTLALGLLAAATQWGRNLVRRVIGRWQLDHRTLHSGWPVHLPPEGSGTGARVAVFCAPSRHFRRTRFDVAKAVAFAHNELAFAGRVAYSGVDDGIRIEPEQPDEPFDHAWVWQTGKLDLSVSIPIAIDPDGRRVLDVFELMKPVATVGHAIRSQAYLHVHALPRHRIHQRTDWMVGVSIESRLADFTSVPSWEALRFPIAAPPRLAADAKPFCPPTGYGTDRLRGSWRRPPSLDEVLITFLSAFLAQNGYHDFDSVVEETVRQAAARWPR